MYKKYLLPALFLPALALPAHSAELSMTLENDAPALHLKAKGTLAAFNRFNDLWLVFDEPLTAPLPAALVGEPAIGITEQERLSVPGGGGLRLRFNNLPTLRLEKTTDGFTLKPGKATTGMAEIPLPFNTVALTDRLFISHFDGKFLHASSAGTGERYAVFATNKPMPLSTEATVGPFRMPSTLSGRVFVEKSGKSVALRQGEYGWFLTPSSRPTFPGAGQEEKSSEQVLAEILKDAPNQERQHLLDELFQGTVPQERVPSFNRTLSRLMAVMDKIDELPIPPGEKQPIYQKALKQIAQAGEEAAALLPDAGEPLPTLPDAGEPLAEVSLPGAGTLLPSYDGMGPQLFHALEKKFLKQLWRLRTEEDKNLVRLQLAKLAFSFQRYHEVSPILEKLPLADMPPAYQAQARILMGAARVLQNRPAEALPLLTTNSEHMEVDRQLWQAIALEYTGKTREALGLFEKNLDGSKVYPIDLQVTLRLSYARALLKEERITRMEEEILTLGRMMPEGILPAEGKLLLARAYMLKESYDEGERLLAEAAASDNPEVAYLAQYEFVSYLLSRGDLPMEQAIEHLENLRFLWRGGQLEQDILYRLGRIYLEQGDFRHGLERLKYFTTYFHDSPQVDNIAETMTQSFMKIFLDEGLASVDPLKAVALYYEFRELTPPGKKGDQLIASVGERLKEMGLFERAIQLLEHQLEFRTTLAEERARLGQQLAELYLLDLRFEDGLKLLEKTHSNKLPEDLRQSRLLTQARLLAGQGDLDKAHALLVRLAGEKSRELRVDLSWEQQDYQRVIHLLEPLFDKKDGPSTWGPEKHTNYLRLVYAYGITGKTEELAAFTKRFPEYAKRPEVLQAVAFLTQDVGQPASAEAKTPDTNWSGILEKMDTLNGFVSDYEKVRAAREEEKAMRRYYNRRMGQPSAPSVKPDEPAS